MVGVLVLVAGIWLGGHPGWMPTSLRNALTGNTQGRLVNEAMGIISHDYYRPVNTNQLLNKGLAAAVQSLDDPYSHYLDPGDYHQFEETSNPHVAGVGIDVQATAHGLQVIDVFPGTPAAQAGLRAGDLIVAVGSTSLVGRSAVNDDEPDHRRDRDAGPSDRAAGQETAGAGAPARQRARHQRRHRRPTTAPRSATCG